jgi:hypothetical protein
MALSILDGNQSATTLSTILSSGQHITAHTVVSLGTQAITDMRGAVSGSVVSISNLPSTQTIVGTVTANLAVIDIVNNQPITLKGTDDGFLISVIDSALPAGTNRIGVVTIGGGTVTIGAGTAQIGSVTASISNSLTISSLPAISGTVTANVPFFNFGEGISDGGGNLPNYGVQIGYANSIGGEFQLVADNKPLPISGTVTANGGNFSSLDNGSPASKIQIGFSNLGGDFVAVNEDGYPFPVNLFVDGTRIASGNPLPISGTVTAVNHQGTAVTTSNFTSITPSTILASANSGREVLTIFNEGAGNLHICAGATCTTIAYQVRLLAGDYYEVPLNQTSLTHSAVFATAGTARVCQVS